MAGCCPPWREKFAPCWASTARRVSMAACPAPERASMAQQAAPLPPPCPVAGQRGALLPLWRSSARAASSRTPAPPSFRSGTLTTRSCPTAGCRGWRCAGCPRRTTAAHQGLRCRTPLTGRLGHYGSTGHPAAACDGAVLTWHVLYGGTGQLALGTALLCVRRPGSTGHPAAACNRLC